MSKVIKYDFNFNGRVESESRHPRLRVGKGYVWGLIFWKGYGSEEKRVSMMELSVRE